MDLEMQRGPTRREVDAWAATPETAITPKNVYQVVRAKLGYYERGLKGVERLSNRRRNEIDVADYILDRILRIDPKDRSDDARDDLRENLRDYFHRFCYAGTAAGKKANYSSAEALGSAVRWITSFLLWAQYYKKANASTATLARDDLLPHEAGKRRGLNEEDVEGFITEMEPTIAPSTRIHIHSALKSFGEYMFRKKYLTAQPFMDLDTRMPAGKSEAHPYLPSELVEIYDVVMDKSPMWGGVPYHRLFFRWMLATGQRPDHALQIQSATILDPSLEVETDAKGEPFVRIPLSEEVEAYRVSIGLKPDSGKKVVVYARVYQPFVEELRAFARKHGKRFVFKNSGMIGSPTTFSKNLRESRQNPTVRETILKHRATPDHPSQASKTDIDSFKGYELRDTYATVFYAIAKDELIFKEYFGWKSTTVPKTHYAKPYSLQDALAVMTEWHLYFPAVLRAEWLDAEKKVKELQDREAVEKIVGQLQDEKILEGVIAHASDPMVVYILELVQARMANAPLPSAASRAYTIPEGSAVGEKVREAIASGNRAQIAAVLSQLQQRITELDPSNQ